MTTDEPSTSARWTDELRAALDGVELQLSEGFGDVIVTVAVDDWTPCLRLLRDRVNLTFFDWLSAVDEGDGTFRMFCHIVDPTSHRRVLVSTWVSGDPMVESVTSVYRGAAWHERETAEMFGIRFVGHDTAPLLLSEGFDGHPLRKSFVLTARASKPWPGAKEPGESGDGSPSRRKVQPPGVPEPTWGPREPGTGHE